MVQWHSGLLPFFCTPHHVLYNVNALQALYMKIEQFLTLQMLSFPLTDLVSPVANYYGPAPLLLSVPQNTLRDFLRFDTNMELYTDALSSQPNSPGPTEIDYDDEAVFAMKSQPRLRSRVRYSRKRTRCSDSGYSSLAGKPVNRGYVIGTDADNDFRLLPGSASGLHCRIYLNKWKV